MLVLAPAKNQTSQPYSVFFTQAILTMILVLNVVLYIVEGFLECFMSSPDMNKMRWHLIASTHQTLTQIIFFIGLS